MNVLIYANCQGNAIQHYLQTKIEGNYSYICNYANVNKQITESHINLFSNADLLIYQYCTSDTSYSTQFDKKSNIFQYLKKDCIKIGITSVYQSCFWPFFPTVLSYGIQPYLNNPTWISGFSFIKEYKDAGLNINDIIKLYYEQKIDFKLKERFDHCEKHTRQIEEHYNKYSDIKTKFFTIPITKFIRDNYKQHKLFISDSHPTSYIFLYTVNEIIKIFNNIKSQKIEPYENIFSYKIDEGLPGADYYWSDSIYARNELGIEWINEQGQIDTTIFNQDMSHNWIAKTDNEKAIKEIITYIYERI